MDILTATRSACVNGGCHRRPPPIGGLVGAIVGLGVAPRGALVGQRDSLVGTRESLGGGSRAFYYTRDELLEKYNRIDTNISGLYNDMMAEVKKNYGGNVAILPSDIRALVLEYRTFASQWGEFKGNIENDAFASSTTQWDEMDNYYNRYLQFRKRWEAFGQATSTPLLPADATISNNKSIFNFGGAGGAGGFNFNALLYLGFAVVGLLILREVKPERAVLTDRLSNGPSSMPRSLPEATTRVRSSRDDAAPPTSGFRPRISPRASEGGEESYPASTRVRSTTVASRVAPRTERNYTLRTGSEG